MVHRYSLTKDSTLTDDEAGDLVSYVLYAELEAQRDKLAAALATSQEQLKADVDSLRAARSAIDERNARIAVVEAELRAVGEICSRVFPPQREALSAAAAEFVEKFNSLRS